MDDHLDGPLVTPIMQRAVCRVQCAVCRVYSYCKSFRQTTASALCTTRGDIGGNIHVTCIVRKRKHSSDLFISII